MFSAGGKPVHILSVRVWVMLSMPLPAKAWGPRSGRAGCGWMLQQPEGEGGSPHVLGRRAWAGDARGWLVPCAGDRGMPGPALSPRECPMGARSCPHPWVCRRVSVRGLSTLPWRWGDVPQSSSAADPPPPPPKMHPSINALFGPVGCLAALHPVRVQLPP